VQALSGDGAVLDPRRDSYDHAFALLALSWLARASGDAQVRALVDRVFDFVCEELTDSNGFLLESLPPALPRRQNPHMHMFEASLAMVETLGHAGAASRRDRYRRMLEKIFIDRPSGMLIEFFGDDWKPVIEDGASIVEPGHMAEWAWLIRRHEQQKVMKPGPLATHLLGSALRASEPRHGFLIDEIDTSGRARKTSRRLWPQTELIKAWVAQSESGVERAGEAAESVMAAMLKTYLAGPFPGGWIDQFDADDQPMVKDVPASSLYHIFLAIAEADRLFG
jgi:mannose-6-phosphate isomerase